MSGTMAPEPRGALRVFASFGVVIGFASVAVAQAGGRPHGGAAGVTDSAPSARAPVQPGAGTTDTERRAASGAPTKTSAGHLAKGGVGAVPLSDEANVARAVLDFDSGRYAECAVQFAELLDPNGSRRVSEPELVERARVYRAACLIGLGKTDEADTELRSAIRNNPQMGAPDSLAFPQAVIDRFLRVREGLMDEIRREEQARVERAEAEAARVAERAQARKQRTEELEYLASQEVIVRENSRWVAALPLGAGQFQNGQEGWGWFFLGSEMILGGTAIGAMVAGTVLQSEREAKPALAADIYDTQKQVYYLLIGASYGFLGVASLGILQAQLAFVPETREVRQRELPPHLRRPLPSVVSFSPWMTRTGGGLGAVGTF